LTLTKIDPDEKRKKSETERMQRELLQRLAELGGKLTAEDDVVFSGTKLVLPETMSMPEAIKMLQAKEEADEEVTAFVKQYNYRPLDGARATLYALRNAFGIVSQKATWSMFGKNPPQLRDIPVSATETEQVPWGRLQISHLPGTVMDLGGYPHPELGLLFQVTIHGPRKYRFHAEGIFELIAQELKTNSMYRGKAFDGQEAPEFLDLRGVDPDKVIYADDVILQLDANVWSLIRHADTMRELGVPLKRSALLEGPYGTGKTLAAYLTAQIAEQCGWTFIYCRPGKDNLEYVMATAQLYQPSVVFFEDVDAIAQTGQEDQVTRLLDMFDGINAKGTEIVAILTTNHKEKIHKGMVRPGRLDCVIHIGALDLNGIQRMVAATVPAKMLEPINDEQWQAIYTAMDGFLPAFVREAIDRTVRYSVARNEGQPGRLVWQDFVAAAVGLRPQLDLMEGASDTANRDSISDAIQRTVRSTLESTKLYRPGDDFDDPMFEMHYEAHGSLPVG
jgi:transitional endoplasmic reticulum ATPase